MNGSNTEANIRPISAGIHALVHYQLALVWPKHPGLVRAHEITANTTPGFDRSLVSNEIDPIDYARAVEAIAKTAREARKKGGRKGGKAVFEQKLGAFAMTTEERSEARKKGGKATHKQGLGLFGMTTEEQSEARKKGGKATLEQGLGIHDMTTEQHKKNGAKGGNTKKTNKINDKKWNDRFEEFQELTPITKPARGSPLEKWISLQSSLFQRGKLKVDRQNKLKTFFGKKSNSLHPYKYRFNI
jgi:general stress protein YciG